MAIDKGEAIVATFELVGADGQPLEGVTPTISFYRPDGTLLMARTGADVVRMENTDDYTAWANTDAGGIHTAVLTATGPAGRNIREEISAVVVDRDLDRAIRGY